MSAVEAIVQIDKGRWLALRDPARIVEARTPGGVSGAIGDVERLTRDSAYYAVGYLAYEAGAAFGLGLGRLPDVPLAWFALFEQGSVRELDDLPAFLGGGTHPAALKDRPADPANDRPEEAAGYALGEIRPSIGRPAFDAALARIKTHLADGDSYQVNFTFKMRAAFDGDPRALFRDLVQAQDGRYAIYLDTGDRVICSASPELFFALDGLEITARPMKGTAPRGRTPADDERERRTLMESAKDRAENVMIVDMVRNDIGRVAAIGTVEAPELFSVERYPTVWQMTSLVRARTTAPLEDLFAALHPSASVTGAPKHRTMEIIETLEPEARGVYTGAVGFLRPDGNGHFNVAIRTAVVDRGKREIEFGVGSGVVWDSEAASEYAECLLKGAVLGRKPDDFELLETTAWTPSAGFLHLERHLARQRASAAYFGYNYDEVRVRSAIATAVEGATGRLRVRFLAARNGGVRVETFPIPDGAGGPLRVALAAGPVDSRNVFLYHKTTNRGAYDRAAIAGMDDVILWNENGEITESTRANVLVELANGDVVTPPIAAGLLAGTARAEACERGEAREAPVTLADLRASRRLWLTNSVYGRREAVLVEDAR